MKPMLAALVLLAALPGAALADDDDCVTPAAAMPLHEAAAQVAGNYGWTLRAMEIDDGCYEVRATDRGGNLLKVEIDPATLDVLKARITAFAAIDGTQAATPSGGQTN